MRRVCLLASGLLVLITFVLRLDAAPQQTAAPATDKPAASDKDKKEEDGIAVENATVKQVCGECHPSDAKNRMSRISYRRTTPEGWQETIRRMVTLNNAAVEPEQAREIVKYLADRHGLAPEESKPASFEVERRLVDFKYTAHPETERICASCHSIGRVLLQRRSEKDWDSLVAMHRGWYPLVDFQVFRRGGPPSTEPGPDGRPPDNRHPMDKALAHLKTAFPLTTTEWSAWSATMRSPRIDGTWLVSGYQSGQGPLFGTVTIKPGASADEFTTETSFRYARSGKTVTRAGRSIVFTGHQWRGRTTIAGDDKTSLREVMSIERDWQSMAGRWYEGAYDEIGIDVTLTRLGKETLVSGVDRVSLRRGASAQTVRVFGGNFTPALRPADIDFGRGVTVGRVVSAEPGVLTLEVSVAADAPEGARDLFVAGAVRPLALVIYEKIDAIRVTPGWNMSRVGGVVFPKMFAQFEAMAFANGPDGKPDTKDDLPLGPVEASWSVEEYTATYDDDDIKFVGEIDGKNGLFTPALDGPNPARSGNRNNIGDVWVVATHAPGANAAPIRARAHLVVTVPLYMRWDFASLPR